MLLYKQEKGVNVFHSKCFLKSAEEKNGSKEKLDERAMSLYLVFSPKHAMDISLRHQEIMSFCKNGRSCIFFKRCRILLRAVGGTPGCDKQTCSVNRARRRQV